MDEIPHETRLLLVQFGNYILSDERTKMIKELPNSEGVEDRSKIVTNLDLWVFFEKLKTNK